MYNILRRVEYSSDCGDRKGVKLQIHKMMMLGRFNRPKVDLVDLFPLVTWQFFLFFFYVFFSFRMLISHWGLLLNEFISTRVDGSTD